MYLVPYGVFFTFWDIHNFVSICKNFTDARHIIANEGYAGRPTHRKHMEALRKEGKAVVPVDGVGGALILLRSSLHREGVLFPPFPFQHAVETEGLAKVALAMGYQAYAMPNVEIEHK